MPTLRCSRCRPRQARAHADGDLETGRVLDTKALFDGRFATVAEVERGTPQAPTAIRLAYSKPVTIRTAQLALEGEFSGFTGASFLPVLEASIDGAWRRVASLPLSSAPTTVSFLPVTAREYRVVLGPDTGPRRIGLGDGAPGVAIAFPFGPKPADVPVKVATLVLDADARVDRFEAKAAFSIERDYYALGLVNDGATGVTPGQVIDLTSKLKPDGTLEWTPPKGTWRVLRLGWSPTGKTNHLRQRPRRPGSRSTPADGAAVRRYLETYLAACTVMPPDLTW